MELSQILKPEGVKLLGASSSKKRLFQDLGEIAEQVYGVDAQIVTECLLEREILGPTGVGNGIALPHARLESVKDVCGIFVRLEKPLEFDAVDRQPVDLGLALFAPIDAGVDHLKALALVSRTLRDAATCTKLRSNESPTILHTILTEAQTSQAA